MHGNFCLLQLFLSLFYCPSLSFSIALNCEVCFYVLVFMIVLIFIRLKVKAEVPVSRPNKMRVIFGDRKTTDMSQCIHNSTYLHLRFIPAIVLDKMITDKHANIVKPTSRDSSNSLSALSILSLICSGVSVPLLH